jgi:NDP-sugar pyrophosphorylase family protein
MSASNAIAGVLSVPMADASRYGTVERNTTDELVGFHEKQPGAGTINAGVYCFQSAGLDLFSRSSPLSFENEVFPELIARHQRIKVCVKHSPFVDIGTPESLPLADAFVREHYQWFQI